MWHIPVCCDLRFASNVHIGMSPNWIRLCIQSREGVGLLLSIVSLSELCHGKEAGSL